MPKYRAKDRYRAVFQFDGRNEQLDIEKGAVVELDDATADFIKRDCPGVLVRAQGTKKGAAKKPAAKKG